MKLLQLSLFIVGLIQSQCQEESTFVGPSQAVGTGTVLSKIESSTFYESLSKFPEIVSMLDSEGPWSVLLPADDAMSAVPAMSDDQLKDLVLYHIMEGYLYALDVTSFANNEFSMKNGKALKSVRSPPSFVPALTSDRANFVVDDIFASNGVVHLIDAVLQPPVSDDDPDATAAEIFKSGALGLSLAVGSVATLLGAWLLA